MLDLGAEERESRRKRGKDFCLRALEEMSPLKPETWLVRALRAEATALIREDLAFLTDLAPTRVGLSPLNINNCMWSTWTLFVVCAYCAFVERYVSYYIRSHTDMLPSPLRSNLLCYGFRYRDELGEHLFPMAGLPKVIGSNFTLTPEQCDLLLDFEVQEALSNVKYYYGNPECPGPKLATIDLFVLANYYRLLEWGNFTKILSERDWSKPMSEAEASSFRNSFFCRLQSPGDCEDNFEHFQEVCPPLLYTHASPPHSPVSEASWKLPWEQYTYRT